MSDYDVRQYGGKGAALKRLKDAGFQVPAFDVRPVSFFEGIDREDAGAATKIIARVGNIHEAMIKQFGDKPVAVRSSAAVEDSGSHSFAGQFQTLLNVPAIDVPAAAAEVWLSAGTSHAYAAGTGISNSGGMAVIVQEMVAATAAGVAFSANPVTAIDEVAISAVPGLGDKLVDGSANADTYIVRAGSVINRTLQANEAVLTDAQILEVAALALKAQTHFGAPQDIEFAFGNQQLYILQSRPITTLSGERTVWDNSNIVESYPGLTLPLTFTFIEKMYESVYRQFTALLGVSQQKIDRHNAAFANMLGSLNGRVYYNLNSWYEALALLPGYALNAAFMERMMGVKEKPEIEVKLDAASRFQAWADVARALRGILKNLRTARKQATDFETAFNNVYEPFSEKTFQNDSLSELWKAYSQFESLMLKEWKAPLVNDFFAMIYFGLLQKQCAKLAPEDPNLHNRLLAGSDAVLTTQPMKELPVIVEAIRKDAALKKISLEGSSEDLVDALKKPQHRAAGELFDNYIERWGERSLAELKLETVTYRQRPELFAKLLRSYISSDTSTGAFHASGHDDRAAAEREIQIRLRGKWIGARVFRHILRNARYFVAQRENLRYYRTRGFGMVRRMMLAMGERLAESKQIADPRDIFWLELSEIQSLAQSSAKDEVKTRIEKRKEEFAQFENAPLPSRIRSFGKPQGILRETLAVRTDNDSSTLHGLPCSAGIVRAPVRLVSYADDLRSLEGAILATYATDPGFVVLFASASGILTERGSLLSHAAIVSREMRIPCIVGIEGLMTRLKDGDIIEMDGNAGSVRILESDTNSGPGSDRNQS